MHHQKSFTITIYFEHTQNIPWKADQNELSKSISSGTLTKIFHFFSNLGSITVSKQKAKFHTTCNHSTQI